MKQTQRYYKYDHYILKNSNLLLYFSWSYLSVSQNTSIDYNHDILFSYYTICLVVCSLTL